jgi:hypothetical protein
MRGRRQAVTEARGAPVTYSPAGWRDASQRDNIPWSVQRNRRKKNADPMSRIRTSRHHPGRSTTDEEGILAQE